MSDLAWIERTVDYDLWAIGQVLDAIEALPESDSDDYTRLVSITAHLINTRGVWLARIQANPTDLEVFPGPRSVPAMRATLAAIAQDWKDELAQNLDPHRIIRYRSSSGDAFENTVHEIAEHVFTHGSYHRGQTAMLIKKLGGTPPATDFIFFARRSLG
ncbi:MAG: DinB family protein [Planctomycetota bacterium]